MRISYIAQLLSSIILMVKRSPAKAATERPVESQEWFCLEVIGAIPPPSFCFRYTQNPLVMVHLSVGIKQTYLEKPKAFPSPISTGRR